VLVVTGSGFTSTAVKKEVLFSGRTMGTTYHIKIVTTQKQTPDKLHEQIEAKLAAINRSMSTYIADSEISRFNRLDDPSRTMMISDDFMNVMLVARQLHELTDGAWDGTIKPVLNLWGFGKSGQPRNVPSEVDIRQQLERIGFDQIMITPATKHLGKVRSDVTLDLASIAKGYAVDVLAALIRQDGYRDFLVEIGGEVYAGGVRIDGKPWRVGVNRPDKNAAIDNVYKIVPLSNQALATSGDYRNFFEFQGRRYSHVIDPRTGYPVQNGIVSVSIIAPNCTLADGLATAVMVMGHKKGMAVLDMLDQVEGLIVVREADGTLLDRPSDGFKAPAP
jgi:thiamine biosynthesis lipoprotein